MEKSKIQRKMPRRRKCVKRVAKENWRECSANSGGKCSVCGAPFCGDDVCGNGHAIGDKYQLS